MTWVWFRTFHSFWMCPRIPLELTMITWDEKEYVTEHEHTQKSEVIEYQNAKSLEEYVS